MKRRRFALGVAVAVIVLALDQASKFWVLSVLDLGARGRVVLLPVLNFVLVWNRGVTFGMLNGLGAWTSPALIAGALVIVAALGIWLSRAENALVAGALGAITGGAVGNIVDRLRYGAVVDFIQAHIGRVSWYVFNLADSAIVCGVAILLLNGLCHRPDLKNLADIGNGR
jgi:lipoprotein signal peptidase